MSNAAAKAAPGDCRIAGQCEDGRIYCIYDRERTGAREILMAVFTEEDVAAGRPVSALARRRILVDRA